MLAATGVAPNRVRRRGFLLGRWLRNRRIPIRTLLALSSGGLVLVATITVLWIALSASTANTVDLLNGRMVLVLDGIESEVRDKLDTASGVVSGFTE